MVCNKLGGSKEITARKAEQMRMGIALGELSYNFKIRGDIKQARKIMLQASRSPKYVYLAALHALANRLDKSKASVL